MVPAIAFFLRIGADAAGPLVAEGQVLLSSQPWGGGIGAALAVLLLAPAVIRGVRWLGHVGETSDARWRDRPVALMGGIAIVAAGGLSVVAAGVSTAFAGPVWVGLALVFGAGLLDDIWSIRPKAKLVVQLGAAGCVLYAGPWFWSGSPAWVSASLTVLWVVGMTNAFNLIDGLDGLAAGLAVVGASVLGSMAVQIGDPAVATIAFAVAGAAGGFLVFNAPPARVFMGDCGSMTLGYVLSVLAMGVQDSTGSVVGTWAPVLVLAVPLFDTTFVTVTRMKDGRSVLEGGVDHVHHRLALLWNSERHAVLTLHCAGMMAGGLALVVYESSVWIGATAGGLAVALAIAGGTILVQSTDPSGYRSRLRRDVEAGNGAAEDSEATVHVRRVGEAETGPPSHSRRSRDDGESPWLEV